MFKMMLHSGTIMWRAQPCWSRRPVLPRHWVRGEPPTSRWGAREARCHHVCEGTGADCDQVYTGWIDCDARDVFESTDIYDALCRGWQRDFRRDIKNGENVPCWFIHHNGSGLIDGDSTDYIVSSLFLNHWGCLGVLVTSLLIQLSASNFCNWNTGEEYTNWHTLVLRTKPRLKKNIYVYLFLSCWSIDLVTFSMIILQKEMSANSNKTTTPK